MKYSNLHSHINLCEYTDTIVLKRYHPRIPHWMDDPELFRLVNGKYKLVTDMRLTARSYLYKRENKLARR